VNGSLNAQVAMVGMRNQSFEVVRDLLIRMETACCVLLVEQNTQEPLKNPLMKYQHNIS
jgi:hypothetical protein